MSIEAIKNYFNEIEASKDADFLYEIKLIILGEERAGKSSISEALSNEDYIFDSTKESTHGINVFEWNIPMEELHTQKDFRVNIWDFGGQEIYHATH